MELAATVAMAVGCIVLVLRPLLIHHLADPSVALAVLFVGLLAVGWAMPAADDRVVRSSTRNQTWSVLVLGLAAFGAGRMMGGLPAIAAVSLRFTVLNTLAAVAEEVFFRRFVYAHLEVRGGPWLAVLGSTALFTIVHLSVYGAWALPIDAAAGLLLGWQRWATGSWRVPALTHVVANLLMVI